jgi:DUF1680 family protein
LTLSPDWLRINSTFELNIPLTPRYVSPHPFTNQDIIALARGPLIYCVEDVDNPWVEDHFKSLVLDPTGTIVEQQMSVEEMGGSYIALTVQTKAESLEVDTALAPHMSWNSDSQKLSPGVEQLNFIPYFLRDNRGGKGHMRVGIRRKR